MLKNVMIPTGNTARFPRIGGLGSERHAAGAKILGGDAEQTELSITLDDRPLYSAWRLDSVDEAMSHFQIRASMADEAGKSLAEAQDQYSSRLLINTSRATPTSLYGGTASSFPGGGLDGAGTAAGGDLQADLSVNPTDDQLGTYMSLLDDIILRWDEIRVPFSNRNALLLPRFWHSLRQFGSPRSAADLTANHTPLFQANDGTYGSQANPGQFLPQMVDFNTPLHYNGINIHRANQSIFPAGMDLSTDDEAKYRGDFTATRSIAFQGDACAIAIKMGVTTQMQEFIENQDFLFIAKMLSGGGAFRAEAAVEMIDT